jgi:hypothetical protein
MDWSMRVNTSLLGMCIVDAWCACSQCTKANDGSTGEKQKDFYSYLAEELIHNNYDSVGGHGRSRMENAQETRAASTMSNTGLPRCGSGPHLTPTKRKRCHKGNLTKCLCQGLRQVCELKTTCVCSVCKDERDNETVEQKDVHICANEQGRSCFPEHMADKH